MSLPIRSVHIKPSPVETDPTDVLLGLQKSGQPKASHAPPRAAVSFKKSLTCRLRFLTSRSSSWYTRRPKGLHVHRSSELETPALIRPYTRPHAPLGFLASPSRAGRLSTRLPHTEIICWCHLTSPDDIINPRHQPRKHVHVSPSPRHRHVIGWRQWLHCSTCDPTQKPETDPDQYPLTLTLDQLTLTFCVDLWPKVKISDRAYLAQFFA